MFYEPDKNDHGLAFNPYKSIVVPRPIGWISTISRKGLINLAPYSQFNNLGYDPPYVMFSANSRPRGGQKDSVRNAQDTGEFVVNMATYELREAVNVTAQHVPPGVDEAALAGLEMIPSRLQGLLEVFSTWRALATNRRNDCGAPRTGPAIPAQ